MTTEQYEKIIREGNRVDWYGEQVPEDLITPLVKFYCEGVVEQIDKLESEDVKGKAKERRENYLKGLWTNVRNAPYTLNKDFYLIKKKRIEAQMEEEKKPKKKTTKRKTTRRTTKKAATSSKGKATKNSSLIFGNKTNKK